MTTNADGTCPVVGQIINLTTPTLPVIASVIGTNISDCGVTDGSITIIASGSGSLEYSINGGATWQPANFFVGLTAGTYQIRVRNITGTCQVSAADVVLTAPVEPVITSVLPTNPTNCGVNDGTITITATGTNLEFSIDGGLNWQPTGNFTGLASSTYNVAVRNADGTCEVLYTNNPIVLTAPNAPTVTNVSSTKSSAISTEFNLYFAKPNK